jgi:2-C-methyl-D-erythritol 4-phosphate cytidylyltransferase
MRASAIIVAAGSGVRLGHSEPKAFVELGAFPLLYYSMRTMRDVADVIEIVVAIPPGRQAQARSAATRAGLRVPVKLIEGGAQRQDSVRIALSLVSADSAVVVVHDAARPFAPAALFTACIDAAARNGGAIAAIPVADTLKETADNLITATRPRNGLYAAQTPQAFRRDLLAAAHSHAITHGLPATDDAFLLEQLGNPVEIVAGSSLNFKITTPEDLRMARALIASDRVLASQFE